MRVVKKSVQDTVYQMLKEGIMSLQLPPGTVMSTMEMATRMNVSRTPVREAFIRLQEEGLVDIVPQKETIVSRIDFRRVMQERFIRENLELAVVEPFIKRCTTVTVEQMRLIVAMQRESAEKGDFARFTELDDQLHSLFFEVARKPLAWKTIMTVNGHDHRFRVLIVRNRDVQQQVLEQHQLLIDYAEKKDLSAMKQELEDHLKKVDLEKQILLKEYPDYFATEDQVDPFAIREL